MQSEVRVRCQSSPAVLGAGDVPVPAHPTERLLCLAKEPAEQAGKGRCSPTARHGFMFDLDLTRASSKAHDALTRNGQKVEIKLTQGSSVALRHSPKYLIVLHRPRGGPARVVFNGPGEIGSTSCGKMQANGQRPISLSKLTTLDRAIDDTLRLPVVRLPPV